MMTKKDIEKLAHEILDYLASKDLDGDVFLYFNNKRIANKRKYGEKWEPIAKWLVVEEDICPLDYFKYANHRHILSMSFEGSLYDSINHSGRGMEGFCGILERYGLYYELGDAWNLTLFPVCDEAYADIEYTDYSDCIKPRPVHIHLPEELGVPRHLFDIMAKWYELSKATGDTGSCVIGAGFNFSYEGKEYFMSAQSPYQGSLSWEPHVGLIREMLENAGATDIHYNYGILD